MELFGYQVRSGRSNGVGERLEANVLVLEEPDGPILVVAVDALYGGQFRRLLAARLDVPEDRVLVLGSHTHFAPGVDSGLPMLGPTSTTYLAWAADRIVSAIQARGDAEPVELRYGQATIDGLFVNRRRPTLGVGIPVPKRGSVVIAPHPRGHVDDVARSVALSVGDRPVAVLWGVSCHPVCSPDPRQISACFAGAVRDRLRASWSAPDLPVLFVQGFSGDVRPASMSRRPPRGARSFARYVMGGASRFVPQSNDDYRAWCSSLSEHVLQSLDRPKMSTPQAPLFGITRTSRQPPGWLRAIEGTRVDLSADISIFAVNAEVVSERVSSIEGIAPHVLPAGCADEVIGYWPTNRMLRERGYEGCTSQKFFPALDWSHEGGPDARWDDLAEGLRR
jgi:hypothetical protein